MTILACQRCGAFSMFIKDTPKPCKPCLLSADAREADPADTQFMLPLSAWHISLHPFISSHSPLRPITSTCTCCTNPSCHPTRLVAQTPALTAVCCSPESMRQDCSLVNPCRSCAHRGKLGVARQHKARGRGLGSARHAASPPPALARLGLPVLLRVALIHILRGKGRPSLLSPESPSPNLPYTTNRMLLQPPAG